MSTESAPIDPARLECALAKATRALLDARNARGSWTGELSSSALSTGTAVCALSIYSRAQKISKYDRLIENGLRWLRDHINPDGGWGDTTLSLSNISTTILGWAAFGSVPGADARYKPTLDAAEAWLIRAAGGLETDRLATAILARYGKDRTFSIPILTMCALAGRLGEGPAAWSRVIPLPFELAAFPPGFFAALRLPVVSYALPALIAIGQARHIHAPSPNPLVRFIRNRAQAKTLAKLQQIQPSSGGFLEATPLTSFVTMSLAGSGLNGHPVTAKAVEFLEKSARPDGSWPIDTDLATWVTTLSTNALASPSDTASAQLDWLLNQQHNELHPYTNAAPGGWAWTDLPGGVPDADDTAGAILALHTLAPDSPEAFAAACKGIQWLRGLQNNDGGIPTFCRGWGTLPFDRSAPDLTAHAIRAWLAWLPKLTGAEQARTKRAIDAGLRCLLRTQRKDGFWLPLWFGNQYGQDDQNLVYGTARVLSALAAAALDDPLGISLRPGVNALVSLQKPDGSWSGAPGCPGSIEETGIALEALYDVSSSWRLVPSAKNAVRAGTNWLIAQVESDAWTQPAPIGFYFAKLWYYEKLYPLIFTAAALRKASALKR